MDFKRSLAAASRMVATQRGLSTAMAWGRVGRVGAIVLSSLLASPPCLAWPWQVPLPSMHRAQSAAKPNANAKSHATSPGHLPTLVYCSEAAPIGFDPAPQDSGVDFTASAETLYNRLIEFKRGTWEVEPALATHWDISPDGRVYTLHLRRDVHFHTTPYFSPTRQMNADDVIWSFHRLLDPQHAFNLAYPKHFSLFSRMPTGELIEQCEKIDDYTVRITLKAPSASFVKQLAMSFMSILSAEYGQRLLARGHAAEINTKPIGTGPFVFHSYAEGDTIRYDGNKQYWKKDAVKLSKLIFDITPNASVRLHKLKRDECQVAAYPPLADLAALRSYSDIVVLSEQGQNTSFMTYNVQHPALQQLAVRQALDMAIDRKAIVRGVYLNAAEVAHSVLPSFGKRAAAVPAVSRYDPAQAKALLSKAGYEHGFDVNLWAISIERPYNPNARLMAELIQADWARIGVRAHISVQEPGVFYSRIFAGRHDVALLGWGRDVDDPDFWLPPILGCPKAKGAMRHRWCNESLDALMRRASETSDATSRQALYQQVEDIAAAQLPISPIAHATVFQAVRASVDGLSVGPLLDARFDGVTRDE